MTRHKQILSEVQKRFSSNDSHLVLKINTFIDGAKWADSNPQFSKEKFIDKVCEWLRNNIDFYVETNYGEDFWVNMEQLLKDIRKAMEE